MKRINAVVCFLSIEQFHREAYVVKAAPSEENTVLHGRNENKEYIKKRKTGKPVSAIVCFL